MSERESDMSESKSERNPLAHCSGISLVEATIILSVFAILAAVLSPVLSTAIDGAKRARARDDAEAICTAIQQFFADTGKNFFQTDGGRPVRAATPVEVLISDGDVPDLGPTGDNQWRAPFNGTTVDTLANHLVQNTPGDNPARAYPTPGAGGWRGAYLTAPVDPDPWGNRYAVNVKFFAPRRKTGGRGREDIVVISAGPDEEIDTDFDRDGLAPGDDDIIFLCGTGAR